MLAPLDNGTIFKKAFTNKIVFEQFVKDIFDEDVSVNKIETEKSFSPKPGNIDFKLDIYAETIDNRFIIEIQRIDYDYNFDRFLHYFLNVITEQQRTAKNYKMKQDVLAVVVLTRPYVIDQKTGEPIIDNVMKLDFNLENLKGKKIKLWGHNIYFLNPHPLYKNTDTPARFQDWLDLFQSSIEEKVDYTLNLNNPGISGAIKLIDYDKISPQELQEAKITASKKAMRVFLEEKTKRELEDGIKKGRKEGMEKGMEKGMEITEKELKPIIEQKNQALIESAKMMKNLGATIEQIQKVTGLSREKIDEL